MKGTNLARPSKQAKPELPWWTIEMGVDSHMDDDSKLKLFGNILSALRKSALESTDQKYRSRIRLLIITARIVNEHGDDWHSTEKDVIGL